MIGVQGFQDLENGCFTHVELPLTDRLALMPLYYVFITAVLGKYHQLYLPRYPHTSWAPLVLPGEFGSWRYCPMGCFSDPTEIHRTKYRVLSDPNPLPLHEILSCSEPLAVEEAFQST